MTKKRISTPAELIYLLEQTDAHLPVFVLLKGGKHKVSMVDFNMDDALDLNLCEKGADSINDKNVLRTVRELIEELNHEENKTKILAVWEPDGDRYQVVALRQLNDEVCLIAEDFKYF